MPQDLGDVLVIRLAGRAFAIGVHAVREVLPAAALSPPPTGNDWREGMLNLRGRIVPVVDLAGALDLERSRMTPAHQLVVVEVAGEPFAVRSEEPAEFRRASAPAEAPLARDRSFLLGPMVVVDERAMPTLDVAALGRLAVEAPHDEGSRR